MKLNKIMCNIKLCRQTNKKFIITNLNKIEQKLIKLLIKINIVHWCKREYKSTYTINFNLNNKINIKANFKKKIFLKKKTNKLVIVSNDTGIDFLKKNKGGISLCLIHF